MRAAAVATLLACTIATKAQLSSDMDPRIAAIANKVLQETGVPSASIGIVQDGRIVYTHAFGLAHIAPPLPASASMAYPIGSVSKQFTAAAVLLLQQQGKLSLNDPVGKYFPSLTRASTVKIINLLTHTSGYQDYAPQDYTIPAWRVPIDPLKLVLEYAGKPLDFEPGTQWQYSNTNYVLAALIVQKVSGEPFDKFLRYHLLEPAGLESVTDAYSGLETRADSQLSGPASHSAPRAEIPLPNLEPILDLNTERNRLQVSGYLRYALAPLRPTALEAPGWYFGDADLAMPVATLLKWDMTILNQSLLSPASYTEMETPYVLADGQNSGYGLGVDIRRIDGQRALEHSGEVGGFVSENIVFPDAHAAIAVLTNQEASVAAAEIAQQITPILLAAATKEASVDHFAPQLQTIFSGLQQGEIDRSLFTPDCNAYFSSQALSDFQSSLGSLGRVQSAERVQTSDRGGMTFAQYNVKFSGGTTLAVTVYLMPDGKIEQLIVEART
jgi:D-alanyl-D-alanine carboxypeptidase